ncbi:MAG: pilus assembly protein PilM [Phycisphaerae bacterium]|nr:pilus assembly protein PilM [Phycisphaerae bacterium]
MTTKLCPIGVDLGGTYLRMAQLGWTAKSVYLYAVGCEKKPDDIESGSADWQRWAAKATRDLAKKCGFKGRRIVTALPSQDVFIDEVRMARMSEDKTGEAVMAKVRQRLPFDGADAMVKHVTVEPAGSKNGEVDVLVMAAARLKVDRHLAIYEKAALDIQVISVWPFAMANSFVEFFSRRRDEQDKVAMLMDVATDNTNIVICRNRDLLFARVIPMGFHHLTGDEAIGRLISEIDACSRYFESTCGGARIGRLVFLSGQHTDPRLCEKLAEMARRMQIPAQIGDVLGAVEVRPACASFIERRDSQIDWSIAFGLSLSGLNR